MKFLNKKIIKEVQEMFADLDKKVTLVYFTQEVECVYCRETHTLLEEIASVSDKIELKVYDFMENKDLAEKYGVDKIPATVILEGEKDYGIKFYGIPSGYEFGSLIEAIKLVSTGKSLLQKDTIDYLKSIDKDVHMQVFVTPTCPYCPQSVMIAHQMAYVNPKIKSDMVEATEFPALSNKYNVMGVPRTVINGDVYQEGAVPEQVIVEKIKEALK